MNNLLLMTAPLIFTEEKKIPEKAKYPKKYKFMKCQKSYLVVQKEPNVWIYKLFDIAEKLCNELRAEKHTEGKRSKN